jgi:hypothetical protein
MARSRSSGPAQPGPKSDAYVGLLFIALVAQITGAVFFYLDWSAYPSSKPPTPAAISVQTPPLPGTGAGGGAGGAGPPPMGGAVPMGGGAP